MKSTFFILLLIVLHGYYIMAQDKIWFEENFDNNKKNWYLPSGSSFNAKIENGKYVVHVNNDNLQTISKNVYIDSEKNYVFTMNYIHKEGSGDIGMVIQGKNNHLYAVYINGSQKLVKFAGIDKNGNKYTYLPSKRIKKMKPLGEPNEFMIKYSPKSVAFYLNKKKFYSGSLKKEILNWENGSFTFMFNGKGTYEIDKVTVYQDNELNLVKDLDTTLVVVPLSTNVNDPKCKDHLSPLVSPDGKYLYFVRDYGKNQDIYVSEWQDTAWSLAKPVKELNNLSANSFISITPDNNMAFLRGEYETGSNYSKPGFSISYRTANGWGQPEKVNMKNFYNHNQYSEFCMSADGKVMILSIERDDTHGGKDLYVSFLKRKGKKWSEPENMGKVINRFGDEATPFLAADGRTLYFASSSHPGYGFYDIFVSRRIGNGYKKWTKPENLGPIINTDGFDAYYTVPASGEYAYITRGDKICKIGLPKSVRPKPVILVEGKVLNSKDNTPIEAEITYYDADNPKEELGIARSNPVDGSYKIALPAGTKYTFSAEKENFNPTTEKVDATNITEYTEIHRDLYLTPKEMQVKKQANFILKGVVYNAKTKTPIRANVTLRDEMGNFAVAVIGSDSTTGAYSVEIPYNANNTKGYGIIGTQEGYIPATDRVDASNISEGKEIIKDLYLNPIEVGVVVRLNNIFFDFGKATIRQDESITELNRVIKFLKDNSTVQIEIGGHTDNVGDNAYNQKLSEERANAVRKFLIERGVRENQVTAKGYGETKPVADNNTEEGKQQNRRVEFTILKK